MYHINARCYFTNRVGHGKSVLYVWFFCKPITYLTASFKKYVVCVYILIKQKNKKMGRKELHILRIAVTSKFRGSGTGGW